MLKCSAEGDTDIRPRSTRNANALDIEPVWTLAAAADPRAIVRDPDPKVSSAIPRGSSPTPTLQVAS
jgi:hypothetical protein